MTSILAKAILVIAIGSLSSAQNAEDGREVGKHPRRYFFLKNNIKM